VLDLLGVLAAEVSKLRDAITRYLDRAVAMCYN